jgi:NADH-quinone oxidoreductase subunit N
MLADYLVLMRYELLLTMAIFLLLFLKIGKAGSSARNSMVVANGALVLALIGGFAMTQAGELFGDMFQTNDLPRFQKNLLLLGTLIVSLQASPWLKQHPNAAEFYMLLLTTLLGLFFMISSSNLIMFYLGLEMSSIPLAALVNFEPEKKRSSEAAFKMIVSSAFASGLLLFGISWIYGANGTVSFMELAASIQPSPLQYAAFVMIFSGFAFKISIVPFHLWTADVYQGAPVPVTAFLSVVSKGAVLFAAITALYKVFGAFGHAWYPLIYLLAVATMLVGNLFAMRQQNIKRFLAFSSVAQMGFILVGLSSQTTAGASSLIYFVLVYVFSNLGAFGVVALVSEQTGRENISDYRGLCKTNPTLAWVLAIALFSLAGIPPTAGFFGKFFLLLAGALKENWWLITIAALNMIVSLYYYLRVIKAMFMEDQVDRLPKLSSGLLPILSMIICTTGILVTGIASGAYGYISRLFN